MPSPQLYTTTSTHTTNSSPPRNKKDKFEDALHQVWRKTKPLFRSSETNKAKRSLPSLSTTLQREISPHPHTIQADNFSQSCVSGGHLPSNHFFQPLTSNTSEIPPPFSSMQDTGSPTSSISTHPLLLPTQHISKSFGSLFLGKKDLPLFCGVSYLSLLAWLYHILN